MKKQEDYIKNFSENKNIISQFLIKEKEIRRTKQNKPYLQLTMQDKTGEIKGRMFSNHTHKEFNKIKINNVYNINGEVREFPENSKRYNIIINSIMPSKKYDMENFIKKAENYEENIEFFNKTIDSIEDPDLSLVLSQFFDDEEFKEQFINAPAAKMHHHNYRGGLLVHTNEVIKLADAIASIYSKIDRDLLIVGAILHDIGKTKTYTFNDEIIDINYEGRMHDHLYIGANMVDNKIKDLNIDDDLKVKLVHMILSHHGDASLGWGSTVSPQIPEAIALHYADDMSAKLTKAVENI
ncbi:MAG: HD domain-containing protein [Methanosphaera sp.]|uniref:3'-5' exoribonuclease YhaM family protein n=1 Tax=Methanosphaera sp. TaxID=2666342 RepID=UPI0025FA3893|nr:HD domain-containing protein [Methanosphaera sp.]MCI5867271.1 HD domain-containing protein [Methanosphaera sp.]MDD6534661.1 HD domain-containing protein [Methanosphaera sp.]MDY3955671.1 HD domain-containing protein [Methanosphaera sp.]